ncbi:metallophosphoesterase family protein [Magnetovibrio blakemorei]|uniref:Calcineurin-like phosphoesterase domain-containing protein n=1 Tax=Magnetovibrio blakemorei TaxID=28181 RepID=A0A1E5Q7D9_9PROT|nr:metallophosphoesterase family protein [Magnetovibrio blakemorei]OEJ66524.1 hypothetical protein BEN30_12105 [Magnetovibrio blakemorei]
MNSVSPSTAGVLRPSVPANTRVYAIGDVHGRADLLRRLLKTIAADAATTCHKCVLVTLGDYVDRGPDSAEVLELLSTLATHPVFSTFERHFLKGNHDHMMEQFLRGEDAGKLWLKSGGRDTLASYGVQDARVDDTPEEALQEQALSLIPTPHRRFLCALRLTHREGDYVFAHAGLRPGVPLAEQSADDVMWIRAPFLRSSASFGAIIVHGHTPSDVPHILKNRISVDTRAWVSGTLTALVLEGRQQRFLST